MGSQTIVPWRGLLTARTFHPTEAREGDNPAPPRALVHIQVSAQMGFGVKLPAVPCLTRHCLKSWPTAIVQAVRMVEGSWNAEMICPYRGTSYHSGDLYTGSGGENGSSL